VDYDCALNETGTNTEHSETPGDFRVSFESDAVVYFLGAENGLVKIGYASDFMRRLPKIALGSPLPLRPLAITPGGRVEERAYHARFKHLRRHGEWFELDQELEDEIDRINRSQISRYEPHRFRGYALPLLLTETSRD
jgi:hypothetical protein